MGFMPRVASSQHRSVVRSEVKPPAPQVISIQSAPHSHISPKRFFKFSTPLSVLEGSTQMKSPSCRKKARSHISPARRKRVRSDSDSDAGFTNVVILHKNLYKEKELHLKVYYNSNR